MHFPVTRLDGLFAGAAIAIYQHRKNAAVPLHWWYLMMAAGAWIMGWLALAHGEELRGLGYHVDRFSVTAFALFGAGLIIASQHTVKPIKAVLTASPLQLLGKYSYGIYVYHLTVFFLTKAVIHRFPLLQGRNAVAIVTDIAASLISVAVAMVSYNLIEVRFLALKRHFPSPAAS